MNKGKTQFVYEGVEMLPANIGKVSKLTIREIKFLPPEDIEAIVNWLYLSPVTKEDLCPIGKRYKEMHNLYMLEEAKRTDYLKEAYGNAIVMNARANAKGMLKKMRCMNEVSS